jgi:hypothetical protein
VSGRGCSERKDEDFSLCNPDFVCAVASLKDVEPFFICPIWVQERLGISFVQLG